MKPAIDWINLIGEAAAYDMFCGEKDKPGCKTEEVIKLIQKDVINATTPSPDKEKLRGVRDALNNINIQLECPARNTTRSYHRDGSVIISSDVREQIKQAITTLNKLIDER